MVAEKESVRSDGVGLTGPHHDAVSFEHRDAEQGGNDRRPARPWPQCQHDGVSGDLTPILENHPGDATFDDLDACDLADEDFGGGGRD